MWINCSILFFVLLFISVQSEIIDVELLTEDDVEAHRVNRDLFWMPEQLVFRIRRNNEKAILRLSKVPPINTSVLRKDGQHFISQEHKDLAAYSDYSCKAVILITRKTQTSNFYNLEGHVQVGVRLVDIKPSDDGSHHVITKQEILTYTTKGNYEHHRSKRSLQIYTVEVGFVADYQNFFSFFGRNNDNLALAEAEMRNYYAFIAEKLKVRYHHINEVDGTIAIDIVTSGLIIVEERDKATFSEDHKADGVVEASIMLNATLSWISNPPTGTVLPPSDHFMFFTGYNLQHAESLSNAGLAYKGVICIEDKYKDLSKSSSIVEDHRDGETGVTASHELGHALNLSHDGDIGCKNTDSYIMSGNAVFIQDAAQAQRPWQFSPCSVRDLKAFVQRSDVNCLGDNRYATGVVTSAERPGQYFSVNEQCAMKYGDNSTFCGFPFDTDKDKLCYLLYCTKGEKGQCSGARVMEYTTCDVNRWCHRGLCIKANNTEPVFVNLPETMDVSSNTQGVLLNVQTFDPDVEDVMTFHITWDPPTMADYLEFNQNTKQVVLKQGRSLTTLTISNFSLIMSVDDGLLLTLPVNVDFVLKQPTSLPPFFTKTTYTSSVPEGNAGDVIIESLINSVTDPDSSSFTFSLQPGTNSQYFSVDSSTGQITFNQRYDYDPTGLPNKVNLIVQVQDPTSLTDTATFALTIRNVDQPSQFLNLPFTVNVAEDTVPGHIIFDVGATDPDSGDVLRYSFTNPSAFVAKYLEINETTGEINLKTTARIDFESLSTHTYQISVTVATDFNTITQILTINIQNKNEPPTFSQTSYSISTTTGLKNKVIVSGNEMTSFVSDPDRGDSKSFQIRTGDYSYLFSIDRNTGQITYAQDYSTNRNIHPPQVNLTVEVTDTEKLSAVAVFIVNVQALNIPPVISNLPVSVQLLENSSPGTSLLTLQIEDPNIGDTHTYQITGVQPSSVPADLFAISGGVLLVNNGAILNFETLPETGIYVTVRVNDGKVSSNPKTVTVTIVNVNERPKFTASKYTETVDEGKAGTVLVPSLIPSVTDEDANDTLTFSLVPSEYSLHFNIDSKTGAISFKGDYDTDPARLPNTVDLFVIARDSGLLFDETDFKFTIQNINQKPIFTNLPQTITVSSQTNGGTEFFSVRASDVDTTDTLVIDADLATSGASQYFNFNKSAGSLSMKTGTTSTTDQLFTITFTVTDSRLTESSNLTVNFTYVPEATSTEQPGTGSTTQELITTQPPHTLVIINLPALIQIPENYATKFVVYLLKTNARDPTQLSFNFTQTPANLPTLFTITNGGSILVKEGSVLDYESLPSLITLSIQATEGEFISIPEFLNITIADINEPAKFNQTKYNFTVTEGKAGEFLIDSFLPFIQDPDRNEKFTFAIVPSPFSDKFRINESTGAISFAEDFDAVKLTQQVNLNIIVKDSSFGFQTTSISFDIKLLNRPPVFLNLPLTADIQRTMQVGDKIIEIQVSDPNTKDKLEITVTGYIDTDSSQLTFNTNDNTVYLGDVSLFNNNNKMIGLELTVTDGQLSTNTTLIITITNTSRTTTELPTTLITTMVTNQPPTYLTTNLSKQPPNSSTTTTQAPENTTDSFESLLRRPWVIAIFGVLGILIPSLIIVVICVIYKRRKQAQAESLTSDPADYDNVEVDQSQKSRIIRPAYHSGFYANPESERQKVYIED